MTIFEANKELLKAVETKNIDGVQSALQKHAEVNTKDRMGRAPLHMAVEQENGEMVRFLILNGADMHLENSNRTSALEISRSQQENTTVNDSKANDIFRLLTAVNTTAWRPGEDPDLLLVERDHENEDKKAKETVILERSQIEAILEDAKLSEYFPLFEQHRISYIQFLRMDQESLREIGITNPEHCSTIFRLVKDLADRKWQTRSELPHFMGKNVSSVETICILKNLQAHLQTMTRALNQIRVDQKRNPEMLRHHLEVVTLDNLLSDTQPVLKTADQFVESVQTFSQSVITGAGQAVQTSRNSSKYSFIPSSSFIKTCFSIIAVNGLLWGIGTAFYLRYRHR